eukprot:1406814-Pleurochrysis_carterae.AAC.2
MPGPVVPAGLAAYWNAWQAPHCGAWNKISHRPLEATLKKLCSCSNVDSRADALGTKAAVKTKSMAMQLKSLHLGPSIGPEE